jgi:hypothetical protein
VVLDHHLPSVQSQPFLKLTHANLEQSLTEFYTILVEEQLKVALEMLQVGNLFLIVVSITDRSGLMMSKFADYVGQGRC